MTGAEKRKKMDMAIKEIVIPFLREQGFKGSYPHFRREKDRKLNLLTFQFSLYGPKFVVEISNCPLEGITFLNGSHIEPQKCRVQHTGNRLRVGPSENTKNYWYDFEQEFANMNIYDAHTQNVIASWHKAEKWWSENPA